MDMFDVLLAKKLSGGGGKEPTLVQKLITANGTYNASDDDADGYDVVTVDVPASTSDVSGFITIENNGVNNFRVNLNIPEGVTALNQGAFTNANQLLTLILPTTLNNIAINAFYGCGRLETITCKAVEPPIATTDSFFALNANCNIYVPAESVNDYKTANGWSSRSNYIQAIPEELR